MRSVKTVRCLEGDKGFYGLPGVLESSLLIALHEHTNKRLLDWSKQRIELDIIFII